MQSPREWTYLLESELDIQEIKYLIYVFRRMKREEISHQDKLRRKTGKYWKESEKKIALYDKILKFLFELENFHWIEVEKDYDIRYNFYYRGQSK